MLSSFFQGRYCFSSQKPHGLLVSLPLHLCYQKMQLNSLSVWGSAPIFSKGRILRRTHRASPMAPASYYMEKRKSDPFKGLGSFTLKKEIEDIINDAEMTTQTALELEEARRIQRQEVLRDHNLWENPLKTNEHLVNLASTIKDISTLKDIRYKTEEAKLIIQLADSDLINDLLFEEAYNASQDVGKILGRYEMSKLCHGPYDKEGACMIIIAKAEDHDSEVWAEKLLNMYLRWAEKNGYKGRVVDMNVSQNGGIISAAVDFESEYCYGYLSGEQGSHLMLKNSNDQSVGNKACAGVEVIPLFLESEVCVSIDDRHLNISPSKCNCFSNEPHTVVEAHHLPTGASFRYSGERNYFANKMKAINRLKAKLLAATWRQAVDDISEIDRYRMADDLWREIRLYVLQPKKHVLDTLTGLQLHNLDSILDGNVDLFLRAHVDRRSRRMQ